MPLHIHHCPDPAPLLEELASTLETTPLLEPTAAEVIVAPNSATARWLSLALARRWGSAANLSLPYPQAFLDTVLHALPSSPSDAAFANTSALTWRVASVLPALLPQDAFASMWGYLEADADGDRLLPLAEQLAAVLDRVIAYRPELVRAWDRGEPATPDLEMLAALHRACQSDARPGHLAARVSHLRAVIAAGGAALQQLRDALPERVSVFLPAPVPPLHVEAYAALGELISVQVYALGVGTGAGAQHPLQQSWGTRSSASLASLLAVDTSAADTATADTTAADTTTADTTTARTGVAHPPPQPDANGLLRSLQAALNGAPTAPAASAPSTPCAPPHAPLSWADTQALCDGTLQVHSCHGPAREVEVLHDQLLRLFDQHADLTPEDVVVMAPDIDVYVPHVESVFGRPVAPTSGRGKGRHRVPFNLGGRRARTASAPANALLALLDLLAGRFGAAELLDFVDLASVKRGAGLATVDAQTLRTWLERAGVRWGVDGADRAACVPGLPPLNEASLEAGLDRLFLGLAMEQDATALTCYRGVFPAEGMEGNAHAALGAFADLCEALIRLRRDSRAPRPMADWHAWLEGAVDALMAPGLAAEDAWALRQALHGWAQAAAAAGFTGAVGLRAVARSLETALDARSSNTPGQGGGVTFNSLGTLSQLPFRVVALLGLGDDFPRRDTPLGFDPLATAPTGVDPARRQDDRGHVLHALRCARDVLILSYPGQSTATGEALPPSVTLAELLDNLAARYPSSEPKRWSFRDALVTRHRLHPFDPAYFGGALPPNNDDTPAGGPLVSHAPLFSYAEHFMSSAAAMAGAQQDGAQQDGANQDGTTPGSRPVFLSAALPPELADGAAPGGPAQVQLEDLIRVLKDPTKEFLKRALELTEPELQGALPERERFDFEQGLENWTEMTRLIELARRGVTRETAWEALTAAGELPLGAPGLAFFNDKWDVAAPFAEEALSQGGVRQPPEAHEVVIGGTRLTGALADLGKQPEGTVTHGKVTFSSAKKKEEGFAGFDVEMWVRHLFAQVTHGPIETWTIKKVKDSPMVASFPVLPKPAATAALEGLLEVYAMAQRAPLPLFPMAFPDVGAEATGDAHERLDAARSRYHKQDFSAGRAPKDTWENALVWSDRDPFDPAFEAIAGEPRSTTLELAERVYGPLRDARPGDKA